MDFESHSLSLSINPGENLARTGREVYPGVRRRLPNIGHASSRWMLRFRYFHHDDNRSDTKCVTIPPINLEIRPQFGSCRLAVMDFESLYFNPDDYLAASRSNIF